MDKTAEAKMLHPLHEQHLCFLQNVGYVKARLENYKKLVRNGKFYCKRCGRVAADEKNICDPEKF